MSLAGILGSFGRVGAVGVVLQFSILASWRVRPPLPQTSTATARSPNMTRRQLKVHGWRNGVAALAKFQVERRGHDLAHPRRDGGIQVGHRVQRTLGPDAGGADDSSTMPGAKRPPIDGQVNCGLIWPKKSGDDVSLCGRLCLHSSFYRATYGCNSRHAAKVFLPLEDPAKIALFVRKNAKMIDRGRVVPGHARKLFCSTDFCQRCPTTQDESTFRRRPGLD